MIVTTESKNRQGPATLRPGYKWELLILLRFAFFLNQADRQIFSVDLPLIKAELKLTDGELGLVASALVWTYGVTRSDSRLYR